MNPIENIHENYVFSRRVRILSDRLQEVIPNDGSVLDVGCGDGALLKAVCEKRPDLKGEGIDVLVREKTLLPVVKFNGERISYEDDSVDVVLFVDVLHHTKKPTILLKEGKRVARKAVVLKDHLLEGFLAGPTLRFMDRVGNARHGVALPYQYWTEQLWQNTFTSLGMNVAEWRTKLNLYPWPASWLFDRSLHFIARLEWKQ